MSRYVDKDTDEEHVPCGGCGNWVKKKDAYPTEADNLYFCCPSCDTDDPVRAKPVPNNLKLVGEAEPLQTVVA